MVGIKCNNLNLDETYRQRFGKLEYQFDLPIYLKIITFTKLLS